MIVKTNAIIFLCLLVSPWALASQPRFAISSSCVTSIDIGVVDYAPLIKLSITLDEVTAKKLLNFSTKNIGKEMVLIDGASNVIYTARVLSPISSPFVIVGIESKSKANKISEKILASKGACGVSK